MNERTQIQTKTETSSFSPAPSLAPRTNLLQRKCACGGAPGVDGECDQCRNTRLQRQASSHANTETVPPLVQEVLSSPGQALDAGTRAFVEPRLGHDFSKVRIHADEKAAASARAVDALAYTVGQDIVFGTGKFAPLTSTGKHLLAHELVHVVQQSPERQGTHAQLQIASPASEREADATSRAMVRGHSFVPPMHEGIRLARQEADAGVPTDAGPTDAGPTDAGPTDAGTSLPNRVRQLACVVRLGGCASSRPAGVPTPEEIASYNESCRREADYTGPDVMPSDEECANPPATPLTTGEKVLIGVLVGAAIVGAIAVIILSDGTAAPIVVVGLETLGDVAVGTELAAGTAVVGEAAAVTGASAVAEAASAGTLLTVEESIASGLIGAGGRLVGVLQAIQAQWIAAAPTSAMTALGAIQAAVRAMNLDIGFATLNADGSIVLSNVGGVVTTILANGSVIVTRGSDVLLRLVP